jgi:hypothetical protein
VHPPPRVLETPCQQDGFFAGEVLIPGVVPEDREREVVVRADPHGLGQEILLEGVKALA